MDCIFLFLDNRFALKLRGIFLFMKLLTSYLKLFFFSAYVEFQSSIQIFVWYDIDQSELRVHLAIVCGDPTES